MLAIFPPQLIDGMQQWSDNLHIRVLQKPSLFCSRNSPPPRQRILERGIEEGAVLSIELKACIGGWVCFGYERLHQGSYHNFHERLLRPLEEFQRDSGALSLSYR